MSEVISILPPEFLSSDLNLIYVTTYLTEKNYKTDSQIRDSGVQMIQNIYVLSWAAKIVV